MKTETLVKDGQTLVLGGIYVVDRSETRHRRCRTCRRLPFLGALFRSNEVGDDRKELLIFVTPRVVETQVARGELTARALESSGFHAALRRRRS